jgi:pimeloyl-ACP methyl ester carboxylesterase
MADAAARRLTAHANSLSLVVLTAGPEDGPPVILLHGFPDAAFGWDRQIGPLAEAGFRVLAPDQRGYGHTTKPDGIRAYKLDRLVDDVIALADLLGIGRFALVGHDWGGVVAWATAAWRPDRVSRVAVLNGPHPSVWMRHVRRSPTQALRSAYVGFFQVPRLPEALLSAGRFAALRRALVQGSRPGAFERGEVDRYVEAWSEPGALTAMLNWYRAGRYRVRPVGRIAPPALILWGRHDRYLEPANATGALELCHQGRLEWFEAGHWLHREEAEAVNAALISFLSDG